MLENSYTADETVGVALHHASWFRVLVLGKCVGGGYKAYYMIESV